MSLDAADIIEILLLVAGGLGLIFKVGRQVERTDAKIDSGIRDLKHEVNTMGVRLDGRIDRVGDRVERTEKRLSGIERHRDEAA